MDPRRWRCGDRCATGRRFAARGQGQGHPVDSPGGCPPAAPTPAHRLPGLPHISTAGGLAAAIGATTLIFFQPLLRGCRPCALRLPIPLHCRTETGGGAGQNGRGNPVGVPQGGRRGARRADRGAARPRPLGGRITPSGGLLEGEGEPPEGWGNPLWGCPAKRQFETFL